LPVHRHEHTHVATVYAFTSEIDIWLGTRRADPNPEAEVPPDAALPAKRLIILPFRLLQADPRIQYLSLGLADAIATSLCGLDSLTVRSSVVGAQYVGDIDLKRIAKESAVDLVVTGTLLRSGEQLRVTAQLVEAGSGTAVWSDTSHGRLTDVFQLQDQVATRILEALTLPLEAREGRLSIRDVPANPTAYEYYLRANELAYDFDPAARDLYSCCLEEDPDYAPAWARLGRICRILAKFGGDPENFAKAEAALARALELRPGLAEAHNQLAYLEADSNLADRAMVRLLTLTETRRNDAEVFAGLVHVCRFCGLLEASIAAHGRAIKLDPTIRTSVCHTFFLLGDFQRALETSREVIGYLGPLAMFSLGRVQEAIELARRVERTNTPLPLVRCAFSSSRALVEGARAEAIEVSERMISLIVRGPEELFQQSRHLAYLSENGRALAVLARGVDQGFFCYPALARDPWLQPLRVYPEFEAILQRAQERHRAAVRMFVDAGGERVLGVLPAPRA
jgi:TolB-like protein